MDRTICLKHLVVSAIVLVAMLLVPGNSNTEVSLRDVIVASRDGGGSSPAGILASVTPLSAMRRRELRLAMADPDPFVRRTAVEMLTLACNFPGYAILPVAIYVTYIAGDLKAIPFSHLFAAESQQST